jgi:hypothetical protein
MFFCGISSPSGKILAKPNSNNNVVRSAEVRRQNMTLMPVAVRTVNLQMNHSEFRIAVKF